MHINEEIKSEYPVYKGVLYQCCFCHTMFISQQFLEKHQLKCINLKIYSLLKEKLILKPKSRGQTNYCDICRLSFRNYIEYQLHQQKRHTLDINRLYNCKKCSSSFKSKSNLIIHINHVHLNISDYKKCEMCDLICHKNSLARHLLIHSDQRPHECHLCHVTFKFKHRLKNHISSVHEKVKKYLCNICMNKFADKSSLTKHYQVHNNTRPYSCDECDQSFKYKRNLKSHVMNVHKQERKSQCDLCMKMFRDKTGLRRHRRVHTGERPFKCNECHRSFKLKSTLSRHIVNIHRLKEITNQKQISF